MAKYALAKYILTVSIPQSVSALFGLRSLTIGGSGSYTDSINIEYNSDFWSVEGDHVGSHVFNRNDDRTGRVSVTLSQLSDRVRQFITLCNVYASSAQIEEGLTMELRSLDGTMIATCNDVMPVRIPPQAFGATAANQTWDFASGEITFH